MKLLKNIARGFGALVALAGVALSQIVPTPSTVDQVNAGVNRTTFVSPYTLANWSGGGGGGAPVGATYITQIPNGGLSNEQALSLLGTGLVKNTTTTGVLSIASAGTDYVAPGGAFSGTTGTFSSLTSGRVPIVSTGGLLTDDAGLLYNAGTDTLTSGTFVGALTGNATTVTTNANLTGAVTSTGNASVLGSFTFAALNTAVSDADVARTDAANTFTGVQSMTSPAVTTSLTTPSTTFALANTTATTVNAFGAATTVNTGAAATQIWNFGGSTTASEFRFLEPSGSGTNYSAFKAVAQAGNITYSLPPTAVAGGVWTDVAGNGVLTSVVPGGAGTVTISGASLTDFAIATGAGTTVVKTPSATSTLDASGNMSLAGTMTSGTAAAATGIYTVTGLTSGAFKITGADAMAQTVTMSLAAQTVGAATLTIPDLAGVAKTVAWLQSPAFTTPNVGAALGTSLALGSDPADAGVLRLENAAVIGWEASPAGTDVTLTVNSSEQFVFSNALLSPTLVTPALGVATATSINGNIFTTGSSTYTGTAGQTYTFPTTSATIARTDAANVFTGTQDIAAAGVRLTGSNGSLTFLGLGTGADEDLKLDLDTTTNTATISSTTGVTTVAMGAIGISSTGTNSIGPLVDAVDGATPLHSITATYAAGTVYALTATSAAVDFGTTDPVVVPVNAGTYLLYGRVVLKYTGATFAANRTVTLKIRRTNNTAADVANSTSVLTTGIISGITATFLEVSFPPVLYTTANTNDSLTIFADIDVVPTAGSLDASAASLVASRQY